MPWRIAFNSPSLAGLYAAVEAGLGVTPRTAEGIPSRLRVLGAESGLPEMTSTIDLFLHVGMENPLPATDRLREALMETLATGLVSRMAGRPTKVRA